MPTNQVSIRNFTFTPANIRVSVGTTVTWTNNDAPTHTVSSRDGTFDSGSLSTGATFQYTFAQKGTYEYYCKFHTSMNGKVVVE
jgi:plastocyanin